MFGIVE